MTIHVRINEHNLEAWLRSPLGPAHRHVTRVTRAVAAAAALHCPVSPGGGLLRASIDHRVDVGPHRIVGTIFATQHYAEWVHQGTGIYGPRRHRIVPTKAKVLAWPEGRPTHFARSVAGQKEQPFLWEGLRDVTGAKARRRR